MVRVPAVQGSAGVSKAAGPQEGDVFMRTSRSKAPWAAAVGREAGARPADPRAVMFNIWRSASISGLEIIHTNIHEHSYPRHMHDSLEIIWIRSGQGRLDCRSRTWEVLTGEALVIPPNEVHSGSGCQSNLEFMAIHLPRLLLQQVFPSSPVASARAAMVVPLKVLGQEKASSLLPILVRTLCLDLPVDQLKFVLQPILAQILDAPECDSGQILEHVAMHPAVSKAQAIIRDQCADRVHISHLARDVDLDMRYLISLFKLATGMTPHQFQIALRVELARWLIEQLDLPLCEVAARAGFADQSHLNRHFRRRYGFTPGAFRQSVVVWPRILL